MRRIRVGQRGVTLIEVMISMAIFTVGLLGLLRMHVLAMGSDGHARHVDRATAVAQDMLSYLQQVDHDHPFLANTYTANDTDPLDTARAFEAASVDSTRFDHVDSELATPCPTPGAPETCAPPFEGLVTAAPSTTDLRPTLTFGGAPGDPPEFERYWLVADTVTQGAVGEPARPVKTISVIVRWRDGALGRHRRVVALGTAYDLDLVTSP